jgi:uncharacterized protein YbjT (DUF2867 family)
MTRTTLIAVTGSTGQIGRRVATRLAATGTSQRLLVRDTTSTDAGSSLTDKSIRWHPASVTEPPRPDRSRHAARDRSIFTRQSLGDPSPERAFEISAHRWPAR